MTTLTRDEARRLLSNRQPTKAKYKNTRTSIGGHTFDSAKEARYYANLLLREKAGEVAEVTLQPVYPVVIGGVTVKDDRGVPIKIKPDFRFRDLQSGLVHIVDVKSPVTKKNPTYRLKRHLFRAAYGFDIEEA